MTEAMKFVVTAHQHIKTAQVFWKTSKDIKQANAQDLCSNSVPAPKEVKRFAHVWMKTLAA
jgi:hypothetical protein